MVRSYANKPYSLERNPYYHHISMEQLDRANSTMQDRLGWSLSRNIVLQQLYAHTIVSPRFRLSMWRSGESLHPPIFGKRSSCIKGYWHIPVKLAISTFLKNNGCRWFLRNGSWECDCSQMLHILLNWQWLNAGCIQNSWFVVTAQQRRTEKIPLVFSDSFKGTNGERGRK